MDAELLQFIDAKTAGPASGRCELVLNAEHFDTVVVRGMLKATGSIEVMTADLKAMLVPQAGQRNAPSIIEHWAKLAKQGVEIRVLHAGVPTGPTLKAIKKIGNLPNLTLRRCPRVHSKTVVVDAAACYLGSANITGAGLGAKGPHKRNMEMGVWSTAETIVEAVQDEFNRVWEGNACEGCLRKDVCPVPLEEPAL